MRLCDFKSNEYTTLIGGKLYEPSEENPMLGFRGASRYVDPAFRPCFELECRALQRVREAMGLTNVRIMVPFVRTAAEAAQVVKLLAEKRPPRRTSGPQALHDVRAADQRTACPSLPSVFRRHVDRLEGRMTQLTLGVDRDSAIVAKLFDERDEALKMLLYMAISGCRSQNKYIGICGQGPSDPPELTRWLLKEGIDSLSLNPDSVVETCMSLGNSVVRTGLFRSPGAARAAGQRDRQPVQVQSQTALEQ